jgi:hypothetical protein
MQCNCELDRAQRAAGAPIDLGAAHLCRLSAELGLSELPAPASIASRSSYVHDLLAIAFGGVDARGETLLEEESEHAAEPRPGDEAISGCRGMANVCTCETTGMTGPVTDCHGDFRFALSDSMNKQSCRSRVYEQNNAKFLNSRLTPHSQLCL